MPSTGFGLGAASVSRAAVSMVLLLPSCSPEARVADVPTVSIVPERASGSAEPSSARNERPAATADASRSVEPTERCRKLLVRFGRRAAEVELEPCVEALTTGAEKAECESRGLGADYLGCFDSCMRGVGITESDYDESDASSSPVENCTLGCLNTDCGT